MSLDIGIVYPLWNHSRDVGNLLDRFVGEVGIDHLTVPAVTGAISQFRPFHFPQSPYFHTEGGWHYPPEIKCYAAAGIKPRTARWCGARDVLADVREQAARLGVKLVFRLNLSETPGVLRDAGHLGSRTAWGDAFTDARACVLNPVFHELVAATLTDLERYEPAGFELDRLELDPAAREILDCTAQRSGTADLIRRCFCPSCRRVAQDAGMDPDNVAQANRRLTERVWPSPTQGNTGESSAGDERRLFAYDAARHTARHAWLLGLVARFRAARLRVIPLDPTCGQDAELPQLWREEHLLNADNIAAAAAAHDETDARCDARSAMLCGEACTPPNIVKWLTHRVGIGVRYFDFEGLEETSPDVIGWLKQAVRYARRS